MGPTFSFILNDSREFPRELRCPGFLAPLSCSCRPGAGGGMGEPHAYAKLATRGDSLKPFYIEDKHVKERDATGHPTRIEVVLGRSSFWPSLRARGAGPCVAVAARPISACPPSRLPQFDPLIWRLHHLPEGLQSTHCAILLNSRSPPPPPPGQATNTNTDTYTADYQIGARMKIRLVQRHRCTGRLLATARATPPCHRRSRRRRCWRWREGHPVRPAAERWRRTDRQTGRESAREREERER